MDSEPPHKRPRIKADPENDGPDLALAESYLRPIVPPAARQAQRSRSPEKKAPMRFFTQTVHGAVAAAAAQAREATQAQARPVEQTPVLASPERKPKRFFTNVPVSQAQHTRELSRESSGVFKENQGSQQNQESKQNQPPTVAFDQDTFEAFVGQKVKQPILALLRDHCGDNLERAVNMFFDGTWRSLEAAQKRTAKANTNSPAATKPSTSAVGRTNSSATARYIGMFGVEGWATRSGVGLVKYGDRVNIERHRSAPPAPSKAAGKAANLRGARQSAGVIVRFTNAAGQEVGRLAKEAAVWVSTLQDQKVARFEGSVVYAPDRLRTNDTVNLQLRVELLSTAFDQPKLHVAPDDAGRAVFEQDETAEERQLRLRQVALVKLFTEINLQPVSSGTAGRQGQSTKDQREGLIRAVEMDDHSAAVGSGASTPRSPFTPLGSAGSIQTGGSGSTQADAAEEGEDGQELEQNQLDELYRKAQSFDFSTPCATPADTFAMTLRPYQQQALHWMVSKEKDEQTHRELSLHPLWEEYAWPTHDGDGAELPVVDGVTRFYVNPYSGDMSLHFQAQEQNCRGGILADEMGLGKTIQMLSLVHSHRPGWRQQQQQQTDVGDEMQIDSDGPAESLTLPSTKVSEAHTQPPKSVFTLLASKKDPVQPAPHTTLVIAPMSLLAQWQSEAEKASKPGTMRTHVYYGTDKNANLQAMCTSTASAPDVVITSYGTVLSEFSQLAAAARPGPSPGLGDKMGRGAGLFSLRFFRIILDEAHTIKNRTSKTAKACYALAARHRWVLTGTPVVNRLEDLFSLVRFLGVEPWNNFSYWRTFITLPFEARNFVRALDVVQTVLEPLVMRRTKDMKTPGGDPLVPLPPKTVEVVEVELSATERAIYDHVFAMAQNSLSENMANGTVLKSYTTIFSQILRLRQVCCHPVLVRNQALVAEEAEMAALADASDGMADDMDLDHLIQQFTADVDEAAAAAVEDAGGSKAFGAHALSEIRKEAEAECPICAEEPMNEQTVTACWHSACKKCMLEYMRHESDRGRQARCVTCRQPINARELYEVVRYDDEDGEGGEKGRISLHRLGSHDSSSKVMALIAHLRALRKAQPAAKTVVFSQFTSFLSIIEPALARARIHFLRLDGSMAQKARAAVLSQFAASKRFTVLLLSLKAGGVGLNLTSAQTVFMMDPWWSFAVEAQAIDRVHRMGQTEAVKVYRFIVKGSVEGRMLKIQERKKFIATSLGMMGDEEKKLARIEDIKELLSS